MISRLHHIEFGAREPELLVQKLTYQFGFSPYAHRVAAGLNQFVLTASNNIFIIVTEMSDEKLKAFESYSPPAFTPGTTADELAMRVNSVYNIAFEVHDISDMSKRLVANREVAPTVQSGAVTDENGCVRYVTVKSCVGDVCHTLLDKGEYKGPFLPTYSRLDLPPSSYPPCCLADLYTHIDHIALGLREGESAEVMKWYIDVLNCKRMMTTAQESKETGLVVMAGDNGLSVRAMAVPDCEPVFTLVLAEPVLTKDAAGATNGQKVFLDHHGGPGVHHVAMRSADIVRTVSRLEDAKVVFVSNPPDTYYEDIRNSFGKSSRTLFVPEMKEHGILVDPEKGSFSDALKGSERYILQKFCRPLVEGTGETVFFEFIERRGGARAFGAGNVTALWKSLIRQLEKDNLEKAKQTEAEMAGNSA